MNPSLSTIILVALAACGSAAGGSAAADHPPSIDFQLGADRTYVYQPVLGSASVLNAPGAGWPVFPPHDELGIRRLSGPGNANTSMIVTREKTSISQRTYQYRLLPRKAGKLTVPGPTLVVDGKELKASDRTLVVLPAPEQDVVSVEISADRTSLYPMQETTVTLAVLVRELPPPYSEDEPVAVQNPPQLSIPWFDRRLLPAGLEMVGEPEQGLMPIQSRRGTGFYVNNIGVDSVSSLLGSRVSFQPKPRTVTRPNRDGIATRYWQYEFSQKFRATKAGLCDFEPASLQGNFAVAADDRQELKLQRIYALASPMLVTVEGIPEQDRPDSFVGAVGQFEAAADLSPTRVQVRDPMTLTITLRGQGALENVTPPDLAAIPAIAQHFMVYEAQQAGGESSTSFIYGLRPLDAGIAEFPSVPLAYFDVELERYVVLHTPPIPIQVADADRLTADQIVASSVASAARPELETRHEGIFANVTDLSAVRDQSVRPVRWFAGLGGMAGAYAAFAAAAYAARRRNEDPALVRRRGAAARARRRLRQGQAALGEGRLLEGADRVQKAVVGLVADVAGPPEAGMTAKDVDRRLTELGVERPLVDRACSLLDARDAARYGASPREPGELGREASRVIEELIRSLKDKRRFR